jgi:hypothetical protein
METVHVRMYALQQATWSGYKALAPGAEGARDQLG